MQSPLKIRSCEIRLSHVAVIFICVCVTLMVAARICFKPQSWNLRYGMTPDEMRRTMGEPEFVLGESSDCQWIYSRDERIQLYFRDGSLCSTTGKFHPVNNQAFRLHFVETHATHHHSR